MAIRENAQGIHPNGYRVPDESLDQAEETKQAVLKSRCHEVTSCPSQKINTTFQLPKIEPS